VADLLSRRTDAAGRLRRLLDDAAPVVAPGCYDPLGARLAEQAGFDAVYMTGFGTAAGRLGRPDVGLLGLAEMVDNARRIVQAVDLPVIADADTGYGNAIGVIRTVQEYEAAGVAAIHLEDQVAPKRCGHTAGKEVVPVAEMAGKIRAAAAARRPGGLVVIARTDARAVEGLDAALERARAYREAGADALFVEAPQSEAEVERIAEELAGAPLVFNEVAGGRTPAIAPARLRELGYRLVLCPVATLLAATAAMRAELARIRATGTSTGGAPALGFDDFLDLIGLAEIRELERRFGAAGNQRTEGART
jgi:2-methylisocitrate lyase-like PEP mutase family enzyme